MHTNDQSCFISQSCSNLGKVCNKAKAGKFLLDSRDQRDSRFSRILEIFFSFSLLVLDLEQFQFHFHFSKKGKAIHISLFFLEKKE